MPLDWTSGDDFWLAWHFSEMSFDRDPEPEEREPEDLEPPHLVGIL